MTEDELENEAREAIDAVLRAHGATLSGMDNPALGDWVVVSSWQDLESSDNQISRLTPAHMLIHHRTGLLHDALFGDWSDDG